jgi:hypothetical protein
MKKTILAASILCPALLCGSLQAQADEVNQELSGSTVSLGIAADGSPEGSISHGTSRNLKNGKRTKEGTTFVVHAKFNPYILPVPCSFEVNGLGISGLKFVYGFSDSVSTLDNGDILVGGLDPDQTSAICIDPGPGGLSPGVFEIRTYRIVEGGSGLASSACGYVNFVGVGVSKGPNRMGAFSGTQTGEIFQDAADAPPGTPGCD